ncbi:SRPBCC family protein [Flavobacterium beibuense]|uniref:Polyketide_cyc2 domain containing protein n=1 Tax=Flavobacterium beibuense TaxID=657326 RepID=A0A444WAD1_9FLAO|nr:SRPBCC family protein [Flavobacterium beibuense]RYJ42712.1 Polyketide_cyc2 domain containing protein [Flavobacterium beibuense]
MNYTVEIEIDLPVSKVIELFDNPHNMKYWMDGLASFELLNGVSGQPGAKSRLIFRMGNRNIEMLETITVKKLPEEYTGTYEANGVYNVVKNRFIPLPGDRTKYVSENYFEFKGFMKIIAFIMPGSFKKQSLKYLNDFKRFAENDIKPITTIQLNGTS